MITAGVRQGGILSPALFVLYTGILISTLQDLNIGVKVWGNYVGCLLYADDILLLSTSVTELQKMLSVCQAVLSDLALAINAKKSCYMRCGSRSRFPSADVAIDGVELPRVNKLRYLGIVLTGGITLGTDLSQAKASFYRSFNTIYSKCKFAKSEDIPIQLLKSKCVPILLYGIESLGLTKSKLINLDDALQRCCAKVFHTFDRTVLNDCKMFFGLNSCVDNYLSRVRKFLLKLSVNEASFANFVFCGATRELFCTSASLKSCAHRADLLLFVRELCTTDIFV
jgi:hypothetical protein